MRLQFAALALALAVSPATADVYDSKAARGLVFSERGESVAFAEEIGAAERAVLTEVIRLSREQMRQPLSYYASIAWSPDEGLASEALQSSANHHGVAAADRAALAACNALRKRGAAPCRIAARILPRKYTPRPLELSLGATTALRGEYRGLGSPKALAISPSSGQFAFAGGDNAADMALTRCNRSSQGANDCQIVVAD